MLVRRRLLLAWSAAESLPCPEVIAMDTERLRLKTNPSTSTSSKSALAASRHVLGPA